MTSKPFEKQEYQSSYKGWEKGKQLMELFERADEANYALSASKDTLAFGRFISILGIIARRLSAELVTNPKKKDELTDAYNILYDKVAKEEMKFYRGSHTFNMTLKRDCEQFYYDLTEIAQSVGAGIPVEKKSMGITERLEAMKKK